MSAPVGGAMRDITGTSAYRRYVEPIALRWPAVPSQEKMMEWYHDYPRIAIEKMEPMVKTLILGGPNVDIKVMAQAATMEVAKAHLDEQRAAAVLAIRDGEAADKRVERITAGKATYAARRQTFGESASAEAAAADPTVSSTGSDDAKMQTDAMEKLKVADAELATVLKDTVGRPIEEALKRRQQELYEQVYAAVKGLQLRWSLRSGRSLTVSVSELVRGMDIAVMDAGHLWLVVCKVCRFEHPLLTAAKVADTYPREAELIHQREIVQVRFEGARQAADETYSRYATRLMDMRHGYEHVALSFQVHMVTTKIYDIVRKDGEWMAAWNHAKGAGAITTRAQLMTVVKAMEDEAMYIGLEQKGTTRGGAGSSSAAGGDQAHYGRGGAAPVAGGKDEAQMPQHKPKVNPNIICYRCGKKGHPKFLCPQNNEKPEGTAAPAVTEPGASDAAAEKKKARAQAIAISKKMAEKAQKAKEKAITLQKQAEKAAAAVDGSNIGDDSDDSSDEAGMAVSPGPGGAPSGSASAHHHVQVIQLGRRNAVMTEQAIREAAERYGERIGEPDHGDRVCMLSDRQTLSYAAVAAKGEAAIHVHNASKLHTGISKLHTDKLQDGSKLHADGKLRADSKLHTGISKTTAVNKTVSHRQLTLKRTADQAEQDEVVRAIKAVEDMERASGLPLQRQSAMDAWTVAAEVDEKELSSNDDSEDDGWQAVTGKKAKRDRSPTAKDERTLQKAQKWMERQMHRQDMLLGEHIGQRVMVPDKRRMTKQMRRMSQPSPFRGPSAPAPPIVAEVRQTIRMAEQTGVMRGPADHSAAMVQDRDSVVTVDAIRQQREEMNTPKRMRKRRKQLRIHDAQEIRRVQEAYAQAADDADPVDGHMGMDGDEVATPGTPVPFSPPEELPPMTPEQAGKGSARRRRKKARLQLMDTPATTDSAGVLMETKGIDLISVAREPSGYIVADSGATVSIAQGPLVNEHRLHKSRTVQGIVDGVAPLEMSRAGDRVCTKNFTERGVLRCPEAAMAISSVTHNMDNESIHVALFTKQKGAYYRLRNGCTPERLEEALRPHLQEIMPFERIGKLYMWKGPGRAAGDSDKIGVAIKNGVRRVFSDDRMAQLHMVEMAHGHLLHMTYKDMKRKQLAEPDNPAFEHIRSVKWTPEEMELSFPCTCMVIRARKSTRQAHSRRPTATHPMQYQSIDASGVINWDFTHAEREVSWLHQHCMYGWNRYALMVDAFSQHLVVGTFAKSTPGTIARFYRRHLIRGERQTGHPVKKVFMDHGGENMVKEFREYMEEKGIDTSIAPTGDKETQGAVEVYMGKLWSLAFILCFVADIHPIFMNMALKHAVWEMNQRTSRGKPKSRHEMFYGAAPVRSDRVVPQLFSDAFVTVYPDKAGMRKSHDKQYGKKAAAIFCGVQEDAYRYLVLADTETDCKPYFFVAKEGVVFTGKFTHGRQQYHFGRRRGSGTQHQVSNEERVKMLEQMATVDGVVQIQDCRLQFTGVDDETVHEDGVLRPELEGNSKEEVVTGKAEATDQDNMGSDDNDEDDDVREDLNEQIVRFQVTDEVMDESTTRPMARPETVDLQPFLLRSRTGRTLKSVDHGPMVSTAIDRGDQDANKRYTRYEQARNASLSKRLVAKPELGAAVVQKAMTNITALERIRQTRTRAEQQEDMVQLMMDTMNIEHDRAFFTRPGPANAKEFYSDPELKGWQAAKDKEDNALIERGTYVLVDEKDIPAGTSILESRYVATTKCNSESEEMKKMRMVVMDIRRGPVDAKNYSPVVKSKSMNVIVLLCALMDMMMFQIDYDNAFVQAELDKDDHIYVRFPRGYETPAGAAGKVMKLRKSLYGLQQAPIAWYKKVTDWIKSEGWTEARFSDRCVFYRKTEHGGFMIFGIHVDDQIGGVTRDPRDIKWFKKFMKAMADKFGIKNLGTPKYALGVDIHRDEATGDVWMSQKTFIKQMLEGLGLDKGYPAKAAERHKNKKLQHKAISMTRQALQKDEEKREVAGHTPSRFRAIVGELIFATKTRPDIAHVVNLLARMLHVQEQEEMMAEIQVIVDEDDKVKRSKIQQARQREQQRVMAELRMGCTLLTSGMEGTIMVEPLIEDHYQAAEHVCHYLRGTINYGLRFRNGGRRGIVSMKDIKIIIAAMSDADFMGDVQDGKSTTGLVATVNGAPVVWMSKKQTAVARSTFSAEYVAMAMAIDEVNWLRQFLEQMGFDVEQPSVIWGDNDANNNIAHDIRKHENARSVSNAYHFIRDEAHVQGHVRIMRVDSKDNVADIFTKTLAADQFVYLRDKLVQLVPG